MDLLFVSLGLCVLFGIELLYFRIANHYNIIDKPNHRSSHTAITIRGGGIIFPIALLLYAVFTGFNYPYFITGLLFISLISFLDDIKELSSKIRVLFHLIAVTLLFYQVGLFYLPVYLIVLALIFVIGTINAINFMDGINGITGGYSLATLATLYYINSAVVNYTDSGYLIMIALAVLVFNFFNFRKKAKCFAGDVGSVSLAFIIAFFLLQLIIKTENITYVLLLLIYGLDTITTIVFRLIRKENIFKAHRTHFYQYLANEKKIPQVIVSLLYMFLQVLFNYLLITFLINSLSKTVQSVSIIIIAFLIIRLLIESPKRLFTVTH